MLLFASKFKKSVKKATHEVWEEQSELVAVVQQTLASIQAVKVFGQEGAEEEIFSSVSQAAVGATLRARASRRCFPWWSPLPSPAAPQSCCCAALSLAHRMTIGELTVYRACLAKFFKPVKDLATNTSAVAKASVGIDCIRLILAIDAVTLKDADAIPPGYWSAKSNSAMLRNGEDIRKLQPQVP